MRKPCVRQLLRLCGVLVCGVFFFSLWDMFFADGDWSVWVFVCYGIIGIMACFLMIAWHQKDLDSIALVNQFQRELQGGMKQLCCTQCHNVFVVKFSTSIQDKSPVLCCPGCGRKGISVGKSIETMHSFVVGKSITARFVCKFCGEFLTIWLIGEEEIISPKSTQCPFCGMPNGLYSC